VIGKKLRDIERNFKIKVLDEKLTSNKIIMVTDGEPDVEVLTIIADRLNGEKGAYIIKPIKATRYDAIPHISTIVNEARTNIDKIAFVLDQESEGLDDLQENIEKKLGESGYKFERDKNVKDRRLLSYDVKLGPRTFSIIFCINGLDEINSKKHSIEDHLLLALNINNPRDSSKDEWKKLSGNERNDAFCEIKKNPEKYCPQQYGMLKLLLGE